MRIRRLSRRSIILGLLLSASALAAPVPLERGIFHSSSYAAARLNPKQYRFDVLAYGRRQDGWTEQYQKLEDLPKDCPVALNGTFFSLRYHQPAAVLVYQRGTQQWTPQFKRLYAEGQRPVAGLSRCYVAFYANGEVRFGNSQGRTVRQLRQQVEPPALDCLMGGGGLLLSDGLKALSQATLKQEGFDDRSGLRPQEALPRTGVGLDAAGRVLLVTAGLEGGGLSLTDFADLFVHLSARQAIFLDCGSSTAMRAGNWERGQGRALPTWLVARRQRILP